MFNKKLLGAAMVLATPLAFGAVETTVTNAKVLSAEATVGVTAVGSPAFTIEVGNEYLVGDELTLTFTGTFDATNNPATGAITEDNNGTNSTIALKSIDGNVVVYRFTAVDGTTVASQFTFAANNFVFDGSGFDGSAGTVTVAWTGLTDSVAAEELITFGEEQLTASVTKAADAKIDVTADRKNFAVEGSQTAILEEVEVTIASAAGDPAFANSSTATLDAALAVATLTSDFTWMTEGTPAALSAGYSVSCTDDGAAATATMAADFQSVTCTPATAGIMGFDINIPAAGTNIIPESTYTASVDLVHDVAAGADALGNAAADVAKAVSLGSAGSNGLNATNVTVYSMPFGETVTPFLWVSNGSNDVGTITAEIIYDGVVSSEYALGTVASDSNQHIAQALIDAAGDDYPTSGRGDIKVIVTSSDTKVTAGYRVGDDRASLETSDTLNSDQETP